MYLFAKQCDMCLTAKHNELMVKNVLKVEKKNIIVHAIYLFIYINKYVNA